MSGRHRLLQLLVSGTILVLLYRRVPVGDVLASLAPARLSGLLGACALVVGLNILIAWRLRVLTDRLGFRARTPELFQIHCATLFYKLFLPGGALASLAVRFYKVQQLGPGRSRALSAVVLERALATGGLALVGSTCWLLDRTARPEALGVLLAGVLLGSVALIGALVEPRIARLGRRAAARLPLPGLARRLESGLESIAELGRPPLRTALLLALLSVAPHLMGIAAWALLAWALDISLGFATWGWIRSSVILVTMLPVSIAGLGLRDVSLLYLLGLYGIPGQGALALATLVFGVTVVFIALVGALLEGRRILRASRSG